MGLLRLLPRIKNLHQAYAAVLLHVRQMAGMYYDYSNAVFFFSGLGNRGRMSLLFRCYFVVVIFLWLFCCYLFCFFFQV